MSSTSTARCATISDGILLTNGLGFSPDGRLLYHSDARRELVRVYDVRDDGSVGHWRAFAAMGPGSVPDGLKVAADGSVWVADAHGGRVAVFGADGRHRRDIPVPRPMVTSLCFGGDDLRDLYIVTGSRGGPQRELRHGLSAAQRRRGPAASPRARPGRRLSATPRRRYRDIAPASNDSARCQCRRDDAVVRVTSFG